MPPTQPFRNARVLGLWHEPPRIRRRSPWRAALPLLAVAAALLGALVGVVL